MRPEDYLDLPYHFRVVRDAWEDGTPGWFAEVEELPGCMTQAASLGELEASLRDAMSAWIEVQLERGEPIPPPRSDDELTHSGRFLVRLPRTLHAAVAAEAKSEGVSLNAFVAAALSSAVAWRAIGTADAAALAERVTTAKRHAESGEPSHPPSNHVTPTELASEFNMTREALIRFVHEQSIPIWHGKIDRSLFLAVFDEAMGSRQEPPSAPR